MKKKYLKKVIFTILTIIGIISACFFLEKNESFADSGFDASYDSSSSYSSSSYDSDYSYSSYDYDGDSSGEGGIMSFIFLIIIIIIAVMGCNSSSKKQTITAPVNKDVENKIKQYIPNFNKEEFFNEGYKIYTDVQNAWMNFKLEDVKNVLTDELYSMYEAQLTTLEVKGEQNIMKDITRRNASLKDVSVQNNTITITTEYVIEMYDYIIEQLSGKVLRGVANRKLRMTYEMKFRKTLNDTQISKCPNCGAELNINSSATCEYCGSKIVSENAKWVLTDKKTKNQDWV